MRGRSTDRSRARRGAARRLLGTLLLAGALASCVSKARAPGVTLSSDPPGALVFVDEVDTGFVTPCHIALDKGDEHMLRFELPGYVATERELRPHSRTDLAYWDDADRWPRVFPFPLFQTWGDFWAPIKRDDSLAPRRVHVSLRLEGDE